MRVERLAEAVAILKALWGGAGDAGGTHYAIKGATTSPLPVQRPHPTLIIGGGSRRVLSIAGREADVVGLNPRLTEGFVGPQSLASISAPHYDRRLDWVREAAGSRFESIEIQCLTFLVRVVPDGRRVLEETAQLFSMTPADAAQVPLALVGTVEEICEQLTERRRRWGMSYWVVHEPDIELFAPVVAALAGT